MVFNTFFNNISVTSWRSVLLVEETWIPRENHWTAASISQYLSQNVVTSKPRHEWDSNSGTDYIASCKSNCHTIMTTPK